MCDRIYPVEVFIIVSDILFCVKLYENAARNRTEEIQGSANAAQQVRRNPGDPHIRPEDLPQPTTTCISRNIYSTDQLLMVTTSTTQLLTSQDINRLLRLCVYPGPMSSHLATQKQSHGCHFLKRYVPYGSTRAGGSDGVSFLPRISHEIIILFPITS
jgi:hypothetical protein